ncbi:MAG TPA: cell division topological specificity factor MinE [Limnochordia bacterium]|nr:cell division topological specificity factor MinE [Limnochordia bacterium]
MLDFLGKLFGKDENANSKNAAKERLRLVLVHDRASLSPQLIDQLKGDLIQVIRRYLEVDERGFEVSFDRDDDSVALVANIPIRKVKRTETAPGH